MKDLNWKHGDTLTKAVRQKVLEIHDQLDQEETRKSKTWDKMKETAY